VKKTTNNHSNEKRPRSGSSEKSAERRKESDLPAGQELVILPLRLLRPHPLQHVYNPPCSTHENTELASDLKANGQRDPIHVMPACNKAGLKPYTMLDGHRRLAALMANGEKTGKFVIRHDLRDADSLTVELTFLKFNHVRRHYDHLAFACNLVRQHEIGEGRQRGRISGGEFYEVVKILASMHGISIRNAQRYVHLACAPLEIQKAYRQGHLILSLAGRVDGLPHEVQAAVARRIAEEPDQTKIASITRDYLSPRFCDRPKAYAPIAIRVIKKVKKAIAHQEINYEKLHGPTLKPFLPVLGEIKIVIDKLMIAAERPGGSLEDVFKDIAPLMGAAGL
jgi:ParB-like nuclease domain